MTSYNDFNANGEITDFSSNTSNVGGSIEAKGREQTRLCNNVERTIDEYKDALIVGDKNLNNITEEFQDNLKEMMKGINTYLSDALDVSGKIKKYIATDIEAKEAAEATYTDFMTNKKGNYESTKYDEDKKKNIIIYDEENHKKDALEEAEKVWRKENCELWND